MSRRRSPYGHATEVARLLRGYHGAQMPEPDDTSSLALKQLQEDRAANEERQARSAGQPADRRAHRRRADKAAYLRDKLAEAERADRAAGADAEAGQP